MKKSLVVKERVMKYYQNVSWLFLQKRRVQQLEDRMAAIEDDKQKNHFHLSTETRGLTYDGISVQGGSIPASPMEREIEHIFDRLDREYDKIRKEWIDLKQYIRHVESENEKTGFYLDLIDPENKEIFELKFLKKNSITQIAFEMNMSKSTIHKRMEDSYLLIADLISYYEDERMIQNDNIMLN